MLEGWREERRASVEVGSELSATHRMVAQTEGAYLRFEVVSFRSLQGNLITAAVFVLVKVVERVVGVWCDCDWDKTRRWRKSPSGKLGS